MPKPNFRYLVPRMARHFMPERLTRFLLLHSLVIRPGLETADPEEAVSRYTECFRARGLSMQGKRILVFGYGGRYDIGVRLLEAGAGHVILCEKNAPPDEPHNATLLPKFERYLSLEDGRVRPRGELISLVQGDIRSMRPGVDMPLCDYVVSSSVYEHLDDVDGITCALAGLTRPGGVQFHYVDLRDHFFKYPFEMLAYSEKTWRGWLDPSSHHNRYRVRDYRAAFEKYFESVEIDILARDETAFAAARRRIRPEFISGDAANDSVTLIRVAASGPRPSMPS